MATDWRVLALINPSAGDGQTADAAHDVAREHGWEVLDPQDNESVSDCMAKHAAGADVLVAVGGDGTVHDATVGLMRLAPDERPGLVLIPGGTANDLANACDLSKTQPKDVPGMLEKAHWQPLDVIELTFENQDIDDSRCGEEGQPVHVVNAVTGGMSVTVNEQMDDATKKWWGALAYARTACGVLQDAPHFEVTVTTDQGELKQTVMGLMLANGPRAGGQMLCPVAEAGDGQMEVVLAHATEGFDTVKLLAAFAAGNHLDGPHTDWRQTTQCRIESDPPMRFMADGEACGQTPVVAKLLPGALKLLVCEEC